MKTEAATGAHLSSGVSETGPQQNVEDGLDLLVTCSSLIVPFSAILKLHYDYLDMVKGLPMPP